MYYNRKARRRLRDKDKKKREKINRHNWLKPNLPPVDHGYQLYSVTGITEEAKVTSTVKIGKNSGKDSAISMFLNMHPAQTFNHIEAVPK